MASESELAEDSAKCINCGIVRLYNIIAEENESLRSFNTVLQQERNRLLEQRTELKQKNRKDRLSQYSYRLYRS